MDDIKQLKDKFPNHAKNMLEEGRMEKLNVKDYNEWLRNTKKYTSTTDKRSSLKRGSFGLPFKRITFDNNIKPKEDPESVDQDSPIAFNTWPEYFTIKSNSKNEKEEKEEKKKSEDDDNNKPDKVPPITTIVLNGNSPPSPPISRPPTKSKPQRSKSLVRIILDKF
jgi:hypothetical protein